MHKLKAYSWLELVLIIIIFVTLIVILALHINKRPAQLQSTQAKQQILMLQNMVNLYKLDNDAYPSEKQGLQVLVEKGYLKTLPKDPWGNPYQYRNPGQHDAVDIFTYGEDNAPEGVGTNATIGNWDLDINEEDERTLQSSTSTTN